MKREYFCYGCGLFHWIDQYQTNSDNGEFEFVPYLECPNKDCFTSKKGEVHVFAVDSFKFACFAKSYKEFINEIKWSSPKFAPVEIIEIYRKQGIPIRE